MNIGGFCHTVGRAETLHPSSNSTWCWEMRRETGVNHDLHCSNTTGLAVRSAPKGRRVGCGVCVYVCFSFHCSPSYWQNEVTPHFHVCHQSLFLWQLMSVQDCVFNINTVLPSITLHFSLVHPDLTSPRKDDPLRQRREHKVITSKSRRLAYVKPETIGKSAAQKDRCGSQRRRVLSVCQRCCYRPLHFPHKKKINSADYQASIKCLLLVIAGIGWWLVQRCTISSQTKVKVTARLWMWKCTLLHL